MDPAVDEGDGEDRGRSGVGMGSAAGHGCWLHGHPRVQGVTAGISVALSEGKEAVTDSRRQPRRRGAREVLGDPFLLSGRSGGKEQGVALPTFRARTSSSDKTAFLASRSYLIQYSSKLQLQVSLLVCKLELLQVNTVITVLVYMLLLSYDIPVVSQWTYQNETQQICLAFITMNPCLFFFSPGGCKQRAK